jgi:anti-sigma factor RsiW
MVAESHPDDIVLFDYVEDDLPETSRAGVEAHLASCSECSELVGRVLVGRDALRAARFLHLPERPVEDIVRNLPAQTRERGRRRVFSPKQLIAVLAPVAAVVAVVAVLASSGSHDNGQSSAAGTVAEGAGSAVSGATATPQAQVPLFTKEGPASALADALRKKGFDASVLGRRVVVKGASRQEVRRALADRAPGDVPVVVEAR